MVLRSLSEDLEHRQFGLSLTKRQALSVRTLLRNERKKRALAAARSDYVPPPGMFDSNKMRVQMMDDLLLQLEKQLLDEK